VGTGIWSIRQLFTDSSEFGDFYDIACRTVLTHQDIFDGFPHKRAYPPFFGLAFYPFCWSTKLVGIVLFWAFNSMCFILCPLLCVRTFWPPGRAPRFGVCVLLWMMAGGIMMDVMVRCETDLIILLALCAGLYLLIHRNRSFWAGAAFSFAAAVKVTPAFLGFYLLWRRNWRAVAGMIVGVIFFVGVLESGVFGLRDNIQRHRRWWTEVVEPYHKRGPRAFIGEPYRATNQSLTAAAFRYLTHTDTCTGAPSYVNIVQWDDATVRKIGKIAGMVLLIGLLFLWWGKGISQSPIVRGAEFSTALIAMLELSEVSLLTHHVVLLVPFAVELVYLAAWQPPLATRPSPHPCHRRGYGHLLPVPWFVRYSDLQGPVLFLLRNHGPARHPGLPDTPTPGK
jgi:hypothetical protein